MTELGDERLDRGSKGCVFVHARLCKAFLLDAGTQSCGAVTARHRSTSAAYGKTAAQFSISVTMLEIGIAAMRVTKIPLFGQLLSCSARHTLTSATGSPVGTRVWCGSRVVSQVNYHGMICASIIGRRSTQPCDHPRDSYGPSCAQAASFCIAQTRTR